MTQEVLVGCGSEEHTAGTLLGVHATFEGCSLAFSDGVLQIPPLASVILLCSHVPVC